MRALLCPGTGFLLFLHSQHGPGRGHPEQQGYSAALAALAHLRFLPLEAREWWHYAGWRATRKSPNKTILCRSAVEKHAEKKDPCFLVH